MVLNGAHQGKNIFKCYEKQYPAVIAVRFDGAGSVSASTPSGWQRHHIKAIMSNEVMILAHFRTSNKSCWEIV
ncbi:MAG: hypothetical protein IK032_02865 [Bacteroidales bacterium]|nr:hypothetical protein [Bacteroidales bacterium]MBR5029451.1 hypothetical protein [Bacteroidales bacterium]